MIQDIRKCYSCKIGSIGDIKIREAYGKLCENSVLREEFKIVEKKRLTCALDFLNIFKTEWIRIVLIWIHDNSLCLENRPIKITKRIIHMVTRYPSLDQPKTLRTDSKEVI